MAVSKSLSFHDQMRLTRIIYFALLAAQAVFFIIAFIFKDTFMLEAEEDILDYIVPIALLGSIFLSRFLHRTITSKAIGEEFLKKIDAYRNAVIVSLAVLEAGNFIAMFSFMLTGEYLYAASSVILFLLFLISAPSENKFRTDLELTPDELYLTR